MSRPSARRRWSDMIRSIRGAAGPHRWRRILAYGSRFRRASRGPELIAVVMADGIELRRRRAGDEVFLARLQEATPDEVAARIKDVRGAPVIARITVPRLLRRTLTLPAAAEPHLHEVIGHELGRRTPLRTDQAYYAATILSRSAVAGGSIEVELAAIPRAAVRDVLQRLEMLGFRPHELEVAAPAHGTVIRMTVETGAPKRGRFRSTFWAPAAMALLLVLAGAVLVERQSHLADLTRQAEDLAGRAARAKAALGIGSAAERPGTATGRPMGTPSVLMLLEELSRLLPDGTWLTEMRFDGTRIELTGQTSEAAALVPLLEKSALFKDAEFRAPVVRDASGLDQFHLAARVTGHGAP